MRFFSSRHNKHCFLICFPLIEWPQNNRVELNRNPNSLIIYSEHFQTIEALTHSRNRSMFSNDTFVEVFFDTKTRLFHAKNICNQFTFYCMQQICKHLPSIMWVLRKPLNAKTKFSVGFHPTIRTVNSPNHAPRKINF